MDPILKRRLLVFGTGLMFGGLISLGLFRYVAMHDEPREVEKVVIAMSTCDVKAGDALKTECVESRDVDKKLVPPGVLLMKRVPLFETKVLNVDVPTGNAFREEDFR